MPNYPRRPSYSIFVRFRKSRLALRRGIGRLEDALAIAEELRASRFHDQGDIFVTKEPEGTVVEMPPVTEPAPAPSTSAPPPSPSSPASLLPALPEPAPEPLPSLPAQVSSSAPRSLRARPVAPDLVGILRMTEQVRRFGQAMERARAAQSRLESACSAAERALLSHPGPLPSALSRSSAQLVAVHAATALTLGSFERAGAVVAHHLEMARADVAGAL